MTSWGEEYGWQYGGAWPGAYELPGTWPTAPDGSRSQAHNVSPFAGPPGRTVVLPPENSRAPKYTVALPTDCEGVLFALEDKHACGDEIVCDAANRIYAAIAARTEKLLLSDVEGVTRPKLRQQCLQTLEGSWVTSTQLAGRLTTIAAQLQDHIQHFIRQKNDQFGLKRHAEDSFLLANFQVLLSLSDDSGKPEALVTLVQALERWSSIRACLGLLDLLKTHHAPVRPNYQPKPRNVFRSEAELRQLEAARAAMPPQVGRHRKPRLISLSSFVDALEISTHFPMPQPPVQQNFLLSLTRVIQRFGLFWRGVVLTAEERALALRREAAALAPPPVDASLFHDPELPDLFQETVKEAEFQAWRTQRRLSCGRDESGTSHHTRRSSRGEFEEIDELLQSHISTVSQPNDLKLRAQIEILEERDVGVQAPLVTMMFQGMASALKLAALLDKHCRSPSALEDLLGIIAATWEDMKLLAASPGGATPSCPLTFATIGSSVSEALMQLAGSSVNMPTRHPSMCGVVLHLALDSLCCFGRFVTIDLFCAVASRTAKAFQHLPIYPKDAVYVPVDLSTAHAAILVLVTAVEEQKPASLPMERLTMTVLYVAFAAAVVYGRTKGFVTNSQAPPPADLGSESDGQLVKALIGNLPAHLRDAVTALLMQKRPQLQLEGPVEALPPSVAPSPLALGAAASIAPGSYTNPYGASAEATSRIDTVRERSLVYNTEEHAVMFEQLLLTAGCLLIDISADSLIARQVLAQSAPVLEQISFLSRSGLISRLWAAACKPDFVSNPPSNLAQELDNETEYEDGYPIDDDDLISTTTTSANGAHPVETQ